MNFSFRSGVEGITNLPVREGDDMEAREEGAVVAVSVRPRTKPARALAKRTACNRECELVSEGVSECESEGGGYRVSE